MPGDARLGRPAYLQQKKRTEQMLCAFQVKSFGESWSWGTQPDDGLVVSRDQSQRSSGSYPAEHVSKLFFDFRDGASTFDDELDRS